MKNKRPALKHDLDGQTFGFLEVIGPVDERDAYGHLLYECRCKCGKIVKCRRGNLVTRGTPTCGDYNCKVAARGYTPKAQIRYPAKQDCNGYVSEQVCSIVEEMFCRTRGTCKFYKNRDEVQDAEE